MKKTVPLISSIVQGPIGVYHLPRLWQKLLLESEGTLADGYPGAGKGFDQMVIGGLGLKREAVVNYVQGEHPTYPQFEAWIRQQPGVILEEAAIGKLNDSIFGYNHEDDTRKAILAEAGIPDDENASKDAISLNQLEDWTAFHGQLFPVPASANAPGGSEVSASVQTTGDEPAGDDRGEGHAVSAESTASPVAEIEPQPSPNAPTREPEPAVA